MSRVSIGLLLCCFSFSLPTRVFTIDETSFPDLYQTKVLPFFETEMQHDFFATPDGKKISHYKLIRDNPDASIVLLTGWTEFAPKYAEVIYDLKDFNTNIFIKEWRGQGLSSRILDHPQKSYIDDYKTYTDDLAQYIRDIVLPSHNSQKPIFGLAHSMGANILFSYSSRSESPFQRLVLSSPMLDITTNPFPETFAYMVSWLMTSIGLGNLYVFGHGPYEGRTRNRVTSSEVRHKTNHAYRQKHPEVIISGATWSWLLASLQATKDTRKQPADVKIPILMLQAGKDLVVETAGQDELCRKTTSCQKVIFENAMHEILQETDDIRDRAVTEIISYLELRPSQKESSEN